MALFDRVKGMLGIISVREQNGLITISGTPSRFIQYDIDKLWGTSKIAKYMFKNVKPSEFSFHSFFALEVVYMFEKMINDKTRYCSRRVLVRIVELIKENTWMNDIDENWADIIDINRTKPIKFPLLPSQRGFLQYYNYTKPRYRLNGALYAADPGAGKTIGGIATMFARDMDYVFVISPKKAVYDVWEKTLKESVSGNQTTWVADTNTACPKGTKWMIFHYERLGQALEMAKSLRLPNVGIILDESHNLNMKSKESIRTSTFDELCTVSRSQDVLWLSGTALTAMGSEAIPLFRSIIPDFNSDVEFAMRKIWGKVGGKANDILANRLGIVSFLVPKESFMSDKPVEATVKVKIPNGQRYTLEAIRTLMVSFIKERFEYYTKNRPVYQQIYDDAMTSHRRDLRTPKDHEAFKQYQANVAMFQKYGFDPRTMSEESKYCNDYELNVIIPSLPESLKAPFKDARSVIKYVDLKIKGECLGRVLGKERTQCHIDMVAYIDFQQYIDNAEKKTLIFTDFVPVLEEARRVCIAKGYTPVVVYGDTNNELVNIIKDFRSNEDINPLVATFRSLAEAVPVTEANNGMMLNKPFRFHHYKQAMARMHRIGQDKTVYINNFVLDTGAEPNISTRSEDIMNWSRDQVDQLMGYDRYGSTVNVPEVADGIGMEGMDEPPFDPDEGFLSVGNEALYDFLEEQDMIVEDIPEAVKPVRSKAMNW